MSRVGDSPSADSTRGSSPAVSVIVLNWNGRDHLEDCLSSLRQQTFKDFEVIVVDNGSADDSVAFIRKNFPEVRLIPLEYNRGFCEGNNIGIRHAQGDLIALLNNDTKVDPNWLAELCRAMESDPSIGSCDSKVLFFDQEDKIDTVGGSYTTAGTVEKRGFLEKDEGQYDESREVFTAVASAAMYRREMLDAIGPFDEDFYYGYEDVDLCFRGHLRGYKTVNVPSAIVHHKVTASMGVNSDFYVYHGQRNVFFVFVKNMPSRLLWKYLSLHVAYTVGAFFFFLSIGRGKAFVRAKLSALRALPKMLAKRRVIQRAKTVPARHIDGKLKKDWSSDKVRRFLAPWGKRS